MCNISQNSSKTELSTIHNMLELEGPSNRIYVNTLKLNFKWIVKVFF